MEITYLKGVGPKKAELYKKLGVETAEQLLELYPRDYIDFTQTKKISEVQDGEACAVRAFVVSKHSPFSKYARTAVFKAEISDAVSTATVVYFNAKYTFEKLEENGEYLFYGRFTYGLAGIQLSSPLYIKPEAAGLYPKYHLTAGLTSNMISANVKTALSQVKLEETLPNQIIERFGLYSREEAVQKIHFPTTRREYSEARRRLVFEELLTLKLGLAMMKGRGRALTGAPMQPKDIGAFFEGLPFEPTGAQKRAINDCISDMTGSSPMNRLLQGDVGAGKTLVAAAAAYFAKLNGYTTLVMAPTEVLAKQHFSTFSDMLGGLGVRVGLLSGSLTAAEKRDVRAAAARGEIDVLIGTQALIQKSSLPAKTGFVVVDEQHRFGVNQRAALAEKGSKPHILAMSATPIPRTLALIVYGDLDVSVLNEMPKGRIPIKTYAVDTSFRERLYKFIRKHIDAGRQAYIVCPLVESCSGEYTRGEKASAIDYYNSLADTVLADIPAGLLYGKMKQADKDSVMMRFKANEIKLLISTTVIEVGIDVPNAVVMMIENAEQFGLSQLHQLRGRVGRGTEQSYCVLMTDSKSEYTKQRTQAMVSTTDGFVLAQKDLELRGPGNFFGQEQHGLPQLKVADIADDAQVLEVIDKLSTEILADDPRLEKQENILLKAATERLFAQSDGLCQN